MDILSLMSDIQALQRNYADTGSHEGLASEIGRICDKYRDCIGVGDLLINAGEQYYDSGDSKAGFILINLAVITFGKLISNTTGAYLRMAEHYFENGDSEKGTEYLIKLCTATDNYEESINNSGLSHIFEKYKHYTDGKVPASIAISGPAPRPPSQCSMQADDIFALPREEILSALSSHVYELSGGGEQLSALNEHERAFCYIDELCMEVSSGGFGHYLYYRGEHVKEAYASLESIGAVQIIALIDSIIAKFPRGKLPSTKERIQDALDKLCDKGVSFDTQDEEYYSGAESVLLEKLTEYVLANKCFFR